MSIRQNVQSLFDTMGNEGIEAAMRKHYAENVSMQENRNPPMVGLAENLEREKAFVAGIKEWKGLDIQAIGVDEDAGTALVEYSFDFVNTNDQPVHYEQVAVQRWQDGKIVSERFYYDTGGA